MKWNPFIHERKQYDLQHLDSFEWHHHVPAGGKRPERTYKFFVAFTMHCFTRDPLDDEWVDPGFWYAGPAEQRIFCFDRYDLSFLLPEIVRSLGKRKCWHTGHGNFFTIEVTPQDGEPVEYEIYFDVNRAARGGWLNLVIQSAYVRTSAYQSARPRKKPIRLDVVAYSCMVGKAVHPGQ